MHILTYPVIIYALVVCEFWLYSQFWLLSQLGTCSWTAIHRHYRFISWSYFTFFIIPLSLNPAKWIAIGSTRTTLANMIPLEARINMLKREYELMVSVQSKRSASGTCHNLSSCSRTRDPNVSFMILQQIRDCWSWRMIAKDWRIGLTQIALPHH